jgi:hypothetical protein
MALEIDVALADRCRHEIWHEIHAHGEQSGEPDWFVSMALLVMQLV